MAIFAILGAWKYIPQFVRGIWSRRHTKPLCKHDHEHKEHGDDAR